MPANSKQQGLAAYPTGYPFNAAITTSGKIVAGTGTAGQYGTNGCPWGNNFLIDISAGNVDLTIEDVTSGTNNGTNRFTIVGSNPAYAFTFTPSGTQTLNGVTSAVTLKNVDDFVDISQFGTQDFKISNSNVLTYSKLNVNATATAGNLVALDATNKFTDSGVNSSNIITSTTLPANVTSSPIKQPVKIVIDTPLSAAQYSGAYTQRTAETYGNACALDSDGNQYVTGGTNSAILGNIQKGDIDFFLTKYQSNGSFYWSKQVGIFGGTMIARAIAVDSLQNIYVTGERNFDENDNLLDQMEYFVAKYNRTGDLVWLAQDGALHGITSATCLALDEGSNALYIGGNTTVGIKNQSQTGITDCFVVRYDLDGTFIWNVQSGAVGTTKINGIATDGASFLYAVGNTDVGLNGETQNAIQDGFIFQFDFDGNLQWTKQSGSFATGYYNYTAVACTTTDIYVAGTSRFNNVTQAIDLILYDTSGTSGTSNSVSTLNSFSVFTALVLGPGYLFGVGWSNGSIFSTKIGVIDAISAQIDPGTLDFSNETQVGQANCTNKYLGCSTNGSNVIFSGITSGTVTTAPHGLYDYTVQSDVSSSVANQVGGTSYTTVDYDVVLVENQTNDANNNTFWVTGSGAWTKKDTNTLQGDAFVEVLDGTYKGKYYELGEQHRSLGLLVGIDSPSIGTLPAFMTKSPSGKWLYVVDSTTAVIILQINSNGSLSNVGSATTGARPQRLVSVQIGSQAYLYITSFDTNAVYQYSINDFDGSLTPLSTASVPTGASTTPIGLAVDDTKNFLYVSYPSTNSIGIWRIQQGSGLLFSAGSATPGSYPRDMCSRNGYLYVGNYGSSNISVFSINTFSGGLTLIATTTTRTNPRGMVISPNGLNLYFASSAGGGNGSVVQFSINQTTGLLTALSPAFVSTGANFPNDVVISPDGYYLYVSVQSNATIVKFSIGSTGLVSSPVVYGADANINCVTTSKDGSYLYCINTDPSTIGIYATAGINYSGWNKAAYPLTKQLSTFNYSAESTNHAINTADSSGNIFGEGQLQSELSNIVTAANPLQSSFNLNQVGKYKLVLSCQWFITAGVGTSQCSLKVANIGGAGTATAKFGAPFAINSVGTENATGTATLVDFVTVTSVEAGSVVVAPSYDLAVVGASGIELSSVNYSITKIE